MNRVGISEIGVFIPGTKLSVEKLAEARGVDPAKATQGLGLLEARVPCRISLPEMAVAAVQQIRWRDVDRWYFATESDGNLSKPTLAVKTLGLLKLDNVFALQAKFACLAGVQSLILACEYVACTQKPAIVVAADRSLYCNEDANAEVTIGSTAVALRVELNANIGVGFRKAGGYVADIDDFHVSYQSFPYPLVDGGLSKVAYRHCVRRAFDGWRANNGYEGSQARRPFKDFHFVAHTPFPKMVEWAMAAFWSEEEPLSVEEYLRNKALLEAEDSRLKRIRRAPDFRAFYEKKVLPGLRYSPYVGNGYTTAAFVSLIAMIEGTPKSLILVGYGSGAGSIVLDLGIEHPIQTSLAEQIAGGVEISIEEYEAWKDGITQARL